MKANNLNEHIQTAHELQRVFARDNYCLLTGVFKDSREAVALQTCTLSVNGSSNPVETVTHLSANEQELFFVL